MRLRPPCWAFLAAALALSSAARADGVLPDAATPVQREQAQSRFLKGKDLFGKKKYADALAEFRASHEIVSSPNTRLQMARCLRALGKLVAAYAELGRTSVEAKEMLAQDNRYQRAYDAATAERTEIQPQLGFVSLTVENASPETSLQVGGEDIRRAAWSEPVPVAPPASEIVVSTPGHAAVSRTVTLSAGQKTALTIDALSGDSPSAPAAPAPPPPVAEGPGSARPWAYVAGGVGAAGLVTFGVFALLAKSTYDDLNGACGGGACPTDKSGEISSGKTQQTVANVALGVGIAGVAVGATLFVLSRPRAAGAASAALVVTPEWAGVRGRW